MAWNSPRTWTDNEFVDAPLLNEQIRDNITHLGGMKFADVAISALSSGVSAARIAVGKWTGNGTATRAITGFGFQPKAIIVWNQSAGAYTDAFIKNNQDGSYTRSIAYREWNADQIISLDSDGVTVGDGTGATCGLNANGIVYSYIAIG